MKQSFSIEEFKEKYYSQTNSDLARELEISESTLNRYIKQLKIPLKGKDRRVIKKKIRFIK